MYFFLHQMDVPGAPAYQAVISKPRQFEPAFKPFDVGAAKLPDVSKVYLQCVDDPLFF